MAQAVPPDALLLLAGRQQPPNRGFEPHRPGMAECRAGDGLGAQAVDHAMLGPEHRHRAAPHRRGDRMARYRRAGMQHHAIVFRPGRPAQKHTAVADREGPQRLLVAQHEPGGAFGNPGKAGIEVIIGDHHAFVAEPGIGDLQVVFDDFRGMAAIDAEQAGARAHRALDVGPADLQRAALQNRHPVFIDAVARQVAAKHRRIAATRMIFVQLLLLAEHVDREEQYATG